MWPLPCSRDLSHLQRSTHADELDRVVQAQNLCSHELEEVLTGVSRTCEHASHLGCERSNRSVSKSRMGYGTGCRGQGARIGWYVHLVGRRRPSGVRPRRRLSSLLWCNRQWLCLQERWPVGVGLQLYVHSHPHWTGSSSAYFFYRTNSNIEVMPGGPDLGSADERIIPDRVGIGTPVPCAAVAVVVVGLLTGLSRSRDAPDHVAQPAGFLLHQSNKREDQEGFGLPVLQDVL